MWIFIIIFVVAVIIFLNYNKDKKELHNTVAQKGGMDQIFFDFINFIEDDFKKHSIILNSNTELEISATTHDNKIFYFGIKLGFSNKVVYRCDIKRSNLLNADIAVEGNKSDQVAPYMMILTELRKKHNFITNEEYNGDIQDQPQSSSSDSFVVTPKPSDPRLTPPIKTAHITLGTKPVRQITFTNRQCIICEEDYSCRTFDVISFQISEDSGKSFKEGSKNIDQELYQFNVFGTERVKGETGSFVLYLESSGDLRCELLLMPEEEYPDQFAVIDPNRNKVTVFAVMENYTNPQ
jgi:hypothetical protein